MSTNPNTVKSQHELTNEGGRKSDVLLATIDELADVKEWQKDMQAKYGNMSKKCERLQKQLDIAVKALDSLQGICFPERAEKALAEIKELDNEN